MAVDIIHFSDPMQHSSRNHMLLQKGKESLSHHSCEIRPFRMGSNTKLPKCGAGKLAKFPYLWPHTGSCKSTSCKELEHLIYLFICKELVVLICTSDPQHSP
jgi:hypothetical protein